MGRPELKDSVRWNMLLEKEIQKMTLKVEKLTYKKENDGFPYQRQFEDVCDRIYMYSVMLRALEKLREEKR